MKSKVLIINGEPGAIAACLGSLRKHFDVDIVNTGEAGLRLLRDHGSYAVMAVHLHVLGANGLQLLARARELVPDSVRVLLTDNPGQRTVTDALNTGAIFRFVATPCSSEILTATLDAAVQQHRLITAERDLLEKTLSGSIRLLTEILTIIDPVSFGRGQSLRDAMRAFGRYLQIENTWDLELTALLSQIGCVTIPPEVLHKVRSGSPLSGRERDLVARVPEFGANLLANIPRLETVAQAVRYQGKHFDGTGCPADEIAGEDIPVASRILKVLSDLHELESAGKPKHRALDEMRQQTGCYDPRILDAAQACFEICLPPPGQPPCEDRAMLVHDLYAGLLLMADIKTRDGILIVKSGTQLGGALLERLRNFAATVGVQEPVSVRIPLPDRIVAGNRAG